MSTNDTAAAESLIANPANTSLVGQIIAWIPWFFFFIFFLVFFTVLKLPEDRLKNYIQGSISTALGPKGITLTAGQSSLSMGFGVSYVLKDVTIHFPPPSAPTHVDEVSVSPSMLSLLSGKFGGDASIINGSGRLTASFASSATSFNVSFKAKSLDLGKLGVLPIAAGIAGSAVVDGHGDIGGELNNLTSAKVDVDLDLRNVVIEQQPIGGIPIPRIAISEGKLTALTEKGRLTIRKLQLGKPGNQADDIRGTINGDITLGRSLDQSSINAKAIFSISQAVLKPLFLLESLLTPGKQPDGSYSYRLTGPLFNMNPVPEAP